MGLVYGIYGNIYIYIHIFLLNGCLGEWNKIGFYWDSTGDTMTLYRIMWYSMAYSGFIVGVSGKPPILRIHEDSLDWWNHMMKVIIVWLGMLISCGRFFRDLNFDPYPWAVFKTIFLPSLHMDYNPKVCQFCLGFYTTHHLANFMDSANGVVGPKKGQLQQQTWGNEIEIQPSCRFTQDLLAQNWRFSWDLLGIEWGLI